MVPSPKREREFDAHSVAAMVRLGAMSIAIRELGLADKLMLEELLDVITPGWQDGMAPAASGPLAFIADPDSFVFGAYADNDPIGWLWGVKIRRPDGRSMSYVHDVEVIEGRRRAGVATSLLEAAIALARRNGCDRLWLTTNVANEPAVALYQQTGGTRTAGADDAVFVWTL